MRLGFEFSSPAQTVWSMIGGCSKRFGSTLALVVAGLTILGVVGCGDDEQPDQQLEQQLDVDVSHDVVLPTSVIRVELGGTRRMNADHAEVVIEGIIEDREIEETVEVPVGREGHVGNLEFELGGQEDLWPMFEPGDEAEFVGEMRVEIEDMVGLVGRGEVDPLQLRFLRELAPEFDVSVPETVFPNASIEIEGSGVLRPDEGETVAVFEQGGFSAAAEQGHTRDVSGGQLPLEWSGSRQRATLQIDPGAVGVHPGELSGQLRIENRLNDGTVLESPGPAQQIETELERTFISTISPREASRGQTVTIEGRGFVGDEQAAGYGMELRVEGTLAPDDEDEDVREFTGEEAFERVPYRVEDDETIIQDVWYEVVDRELKGFGATPGTFEGTITPVVYDEFGQFDGVEWDGQFTVAPTLQKVYLKYLPAFTVALDRYGLANVEHEIRDRILEVVRRDYEDFNVEFTDEPPEHFADYATIELSGPDPRGGSASAFGFDNTYHDDAKDVGNLYLDSYLGGINRETGQELNNPYGGIFVESFAIFSPNLEPETTMDSERFDDIFGPFMPELGGDPVLVTEWPDGGRADQIEEAIRVFGNVVGNTTSHELGHALGMAHFPDQDWDGEPLERFHNLDNGGYIMDPGTERPFEQRANLDGQGPEVWHENNREYLETVLPKE